MFKEKYIKTEKGLSLFTESAGDPQDPSIILIMGAMNQGIFWYDQFCHSLSEKGFFVIRFDHRDTGFSSVVNFKQSPYDLNDMTEDVVDVLDAYKITKADYIGLSMGGYICQLLGINYPDRVNTLTLISTTSDHRPYMDATMGIFNNKYDLPYPKRSFIDFIENSKNNPPQNELAIENNQIEGWKVIFNNIDKEDLDAVIALIRKANKRAKDKYSAFNHGPAVLHSPERTALLKKIHAPTFIFHGEKDPCFPIEHGEQLHALIKDSQFEIVKDMGHMFTLSESIHLSEKIIKHIKNYLT